MALLQDARGDLWAGTEDKGVWRYSFADRRQKMDELFA